MKDRIVFYQVMSTWMPLQWKCKACWTRDFY